MERLPVQYLMTICRMNKVAQTSLDDGSKSTGAVVAAWPAMLLAIPKMQW